MILHQLATDRTKPKGRVGRGIAAGQGKTAGRGTKGQKARTGYKLPKRIPGLMSATDYRLPKRKGFRSHRPQPLTVTLNQLESAFIDGETVTPDRLVERKIIKGYGRAGVKIVARGLLTKKLSFDQVKLSKAIAQL